ncbi:MAG: hypothetical protein M1832_000348 [Thelocarpon impressellum]|nr:MAG: hypothetical protein M1832_000348 [Thelocarpon impressellum]
MRPTLQTFAQRGLFGRSLDEFKRLSKIAIQQDGIRTPTSAYVLHAFDEPASIANCKVFSDADQGGFSRAALDLVPGSAPEPPHARFHGDISIELPRDRPQVQRTGYAAWRTRDRQRTLFGKSLWDIDPYTYLAMRVKSDGRKYFVNVQTESIVPTDLHQHRLYSRRPGEWETVLIKWHEFVRTNHGVVVEPQAEMMRQKVRTVGIGLIDRVPGPFDLCVQRIWATNGLDEGDGREEEGRREAEAVEDGEKSDGYDRR